MASHLAKHNTDVIIGYSEQLSSIDIFSIHIQSSERSSILRGCHRWGSMSHFSLLTLWLALSSLNQAAQSEVYYIKTDPTDFCIVQPCLTLSQFAANLSHHLHSNTTLVFLPGTHYLSKVNLTLSYMDNFVLKSKNSTAQIVCAANDSHIYFSHSRYILITNLEFIGCGGNQVQHVENFVVEDTKFGGQENSGTALELIETATQIVSSTFLSNRNGSYWQCGALLDPNSCPTDITDGFIGGAVIAIESTVNISQSKFENNEAEYGGAIFAVTSFINIGGNTSFINNTAISLGGAILSFDSDIIMNESIFHDNTAISQGGVIFSVNSNITMNESIFHDNTAIPTGGGVLVSFNGTITIEASKFEGSSGGVVYSDGSTITIKASKFHHSTAFYGGVLYLYICAITIESSEFHDNTAEYGGILYAVRSEITMESSKFHHNSANKSGGVLQSYNSTVTIGTIIMDGSSTFSENHSPIGAVIYAIKCSINYSAYLLIDNNIADRYAVIYLSDSELRGYDSECFMFLSNLGSLVAFNSNITFSGYAIFENNQPGPSQTTTGDLQEGGAITLFQSNAFFDGVCNLEHNLAENGGTIHSTGGTLYVNGKVTIAHNTATGNGGGVYLSTTSELNCQQNSTFTLFNNTAALKGGGLHAISSAIIAISAFEWSYGYTGTRIHFKKNVAKLGGGLSLEANAKLYILKYNDINYEKDINTAIFTGNSADYGGAVYVDDDTNSGTCVSDTKTECFFQVLALYDYDVLELNRDNPTVLYDMQTQSIIFSQNYANTSGSTLYGGLLDRCAISTFAEVQVIYTQAMENRFQLDGISYFKNVSNSISTGISKSVSSAPVRVSVCTNDVHNCTNQSHSILVKKGEAFNVSLVAVDQIGQPVNASIQAFLHFTESGLAEGQLNREISAECINMTFNVVSPHNSENLTLYASDGPCNDAEPSRAVIEIHFLPCSCPIGLQESGANSTNCTCECHSEIRQYMEQCDGHTGSLVKQPQSRAWIDYDNDTNGYLVYPNCPFDYCLSTSPPFYLDESDTQCSDSEVNLNQPNGSGANAQCAFNRSCLLCGSCQPGLSLSLGSSRCLQCPSYWPALFIAITIAAILAGIALITLLLVLNMTVAVGTLNGLIFYVNVVYANKSILLPFQETNFITVFISWLNLELGIDTCYFSGMDTYTKTWLQLVFPVYVILLVMLVIIVSSYSAKFSNFIGQKDPVATLATLILLSYAKLLEVCFKSLSVGILEYPDNSNVSLWLPDATVKYLSVKHIPLFIAAVLILLVGLVYTALLFLWQWLLHLPNWRIFKWSRNPKIQTFIETYHTPYTAKHRYWTGLLLIARVVLYLVAATNASNNPTVALVSISLVVGFIVFLKGFTTSKRYKKWSVDALETFFHLNIFIFTIFTWYSLGHNKEAIAYTSVTVAIVFFLLINLYHVYTYTSLFSKVKKTRLGGMMDKLFTDTDPKPKSRIRRLSTPPDEDIHRFDELLDELDCPINTDDYNTIPLQVQTPVEPTRSVVELPKPRDLAEPDPEELGHSVQNLPADN